MAWYRAGGGGIPSSLKTDMNDVLNKKFGTSQDYPPTDWAPTVNLMGPLPEKTASGAIVTFSDGADAVPLKKCEITLPASLDGYSSVDVVESYCPFMPVFEIGSLQENSAVGSTYEEVKISSNNRARIPNLYPIIANESMVISCNSNYRLFLLFFDSSELYNRTYKSWDSVQTVSDTNGGYFGLAFRRVDNANISSSDYENVNIKIVTSLDTTHTASLGRTIYGGTVDVVTGTAEPTNLLDETEFETYSNWSTDIASSGSYPTGNANRGFELQVEAGVTYAVSFGMDSETYPTYLYLCRTNGVDSERLIYFSGANYSVDNGTFTAESGWTYYFRLGSTGTEANFNGQIAKLTFEQVEKGATVTPHSPYFAPFTFDPVPIDSKLGNNTIWSEQGDTEVTYRADINLALGGQ